jgi:predicted ester cyclase
VTTPSAEHLRSFYARYLEACNAHDFARLGDFVAEDVAVNGEREGLADYVAGLEAVVAAFPDYRWDLRHLLVDGCWISAHFVDTGTHRGDFLGVPPTGRVVATQEFAVYRIAEDRIAEVWVAADNLRLLDQLR